MPPRSDSEKRFLLEQPDLFIVTYFSHRIRKLEPFHLRLIRNATSKPKGLILYPATHGKTTLVSELLTIRELCADPNVRMAIIAKNDQDAKNVMQSIQAELLGNRELIDDFGPFVPEGKDKPFGLEKIVVARRTIRHKSPTIYAFGAGSRSALGLRTDWTICDDIVHDGNASTPTQREKLKEWFMQGPMTMAEEPDDRLTVVGTLFDPEDLYHDLIELRDPENGDPLWDVQREDAIVEMCVCRHPLREHDRQNRCGLCECEEPVWDDAQKVTLWPARWPWGRLMERKAEMGTLDFNKRYRNIAVDKSRMVFREEYVKGGYIGQQRYPGCLDRDYTVGVYDAAWRRTAGFDPAVGVTRNRKFCAHVVLAMGDCREHERCIWLVDLLREQLTLPQQVDVILDRHRRFDLTASWIEANSYQAGLYQAVKQKMDDQGEAFRIDPHYTSKSNKPDPELGIQAMAPWFENGWVHIPWADPHSQRTMRQLVDELIMYPGRYTDTVMAFWIAWRALMETAPRYISSSYLRKPLAWGTRPGRRVIRNPIYAR